MKPKFKIGDKVKVLRLPTDKEYKLWNDSVVEDMSIMVGNEYTIEFVFDNRDCGIKCVKYSLCGWCFPEFVLEGNTIGQQLVFDFYK